jgi:hypothetical protein
MFLIDEVTDSSGILAVDAKLVVRGGTEGVGPFCFTNARRGRRVEVSRVYGDFEIFLGAGCGFQGIPDGSWLILDRSERLMTMFTGFGFLTEDELFELRKTEPRLAP